jgi:hypothetical protein
MDELRAICGFRAAVPAADQLERGNALAVLVARIAAEGAGRPRERRWVRKRPLAGRVRSLILVLTAVAAIAIPAVAFASQFGHFIDSLAGREAARDALPDTAVMTVFKRAPIAADALPRSAQIVLKQFGTGIPASDPTNPGVGDLTRSRLALIDAGQAHASLYLVPTNKGTLCMVWVPDIGGGCTQGFMPGTGVIIVRGFHDGLSQVWGIVRDTVVSVSAIVNGQSAPVTQGESSFFYEGGTLPSSLILKLTDGGTKAVPVAAIPSLNGAARGTQTAR